MSIIFSNYFVVQVHTCTSHNHIVRMYVHKYLCESAIHMHACTPTPVPCSKRLKDWFQGEFEELADFQGSIKESQLHQQGSHLLSTHKRIYAHIMHMHTEKNIGFLPYYVGQPFCHVCMNLIGHICQLDILVGHRTVGVKKKRCPISYSVASE